MQIIKEVPETIRSQSDVHHLVEFFAARFNDWPCLHGALLGCHTILMLESVRKESPPFKISSADVVNIATPLVKTVFIRSLSASDRELCFEIMNTSIQYGGQSILEADLDLLEFIISSTDGEKDPRCLIKAFRAFRTIIQLYQLQDTASLYSGQLDEACEELFEIVSCYFPISFTQPPDDPHGITRDKIADELLLTLVSDSRFAEMAYSLALEKLSSSLKQAKIDSLRLISTLADTLHSRYLAQHFSTVWDALKAELVANISNENENLPRKDITTPTGDLDVLSAAFECLSRCLRTISKDKNRMSYLENILDDSLISDMKSCVELPEESNLLTFQRSMTRVRAATFLLTGFSRAGGVAAELIARKVLPFIVNIVKDSSNSRLARILSWRILSLTMEEMRESGALVDSSLACNMIESLSDEILQYSESACNQNSSDAVRNDYKIKAEENKDEKRFLELVNVLQNPEYQSAFDAAIITAPWPSSPGSCTSIVEVYLQVYSLTNLASNFVVLSALIESGILIKTLNFLQKLCVQKGKQYEALRNQACMGLCSILRVAGSRSDTILEELLPFFFRISRSKDTAARTLALSSLSQIRKVDVRIEKELIVELDGIIQANIEKALQNPDDDASLMMQQMLRCLIEILIDAYLFLHPRQSLEKIPSDQKISTGGTYDVLLEHLWTKLRGITSNIQGTPDTHPGFHSKETNHNLLICIAEAMFLNFSLASVELQKDLLIALVEEFPRLLEAYQRKNYDTFSLSFAVCACSGLLAAGKRSDIEVITNDISSAQNLCLEIWKHSLNIYSKEKSVAALLINAVASLLNKVYKTSNNDALLASLLEEISLTNKMGDSYEFPFDEAEVRVFATSEICHALSMRGSPIMEKLARQFTTFLWSTEQIPQGTKEKESYQRCMVAAEFFKSTLGRPTLDSIFRYHARIKKWTENTLYVRPLWLQRSYTVLINMLLDKLHSYNNNKEYAYFEHEGKRNTLVAIGFTISAASSAILRNDARRVVPFIGQCVSAIMEFHDSGSVIDAMQPPYQEAIREVLEKLLEFLADIIGSSKGKDEAGAALDVLCPCLLTASLYKNSANVRYNALECLIKLTNLPFQEIYPYRSRVLRRAKELCDDNKRRVRLQAVRCHTAWTSAS